MHQLPCADQSADQVLLLHALTYTTRPEVVAQEAARLLRAGGTLLVSTLKSHTHKQLVEPFGHLNTGFSEATLSQLFLDQGLSVSLCEVTSREARSPQFEVITLVAQKPLK